MSGTAVCGSVEAGVPLLTHCACAQNGLYINEFSRGIVRENMRQGRSLRSLRRHSRAKELKDTEHGGVANPRIPRCGVASQG